MNKKNDNLPQKYDHNPWMYISSYKKTDANRFKGREEETQKFLDFINSGVMSVLYANSGIGKSSFINAGIIPQLEREGYYAISILFPDAVFKSDVQFTEWLLKYVKTYFTEQHIEGFNWKSTVSLEGLSKEQEDILAKCDDSLWWWLHTHYINHNGEHYWPLLLFDQFEEVFTRTGGDTEKEKLSGLFKILQEMAWDRVPDDVMFCLNQLISADKTPKLDRRAHYKIIFSLRKEYLAEFDYWGNEKCAITELLRNRMLLLPFSRKQAERVITQQPVDGNSTEKIVTLNQIKDDIIDKIDSKKQDEVEPFLLSVLCSKLFNEAVKKEKVETGLSTEDLDMINLDEIIHDFYGEQIKSVLMNKKQICHLENQLVDEKGVRQRPDVNSVGLTKELLKQLVDSHVIRTEFPILEKQEMKGWVEIIHDKVADVIYQKKQDRKHKQKSRRFRVATFIVILALALVTLYLGSQTSDKNHIKSNLVNCVDHRFSTDDSSWIAFGRLSDNSQVEYFSICDKDTFSIKNCPYLSVVDISQLKGDSLKLNMGNCPLLSQLVLPEQLSSLELYINNCPKLEIRINNGLGFLKIDAPNDKLDFSVEHDAQQNFVWRDQILWDLTNWDIIYVDPTIPIHTISWGRKTKDVYFPRQIKSRSLTYRDITFMNLTQKEEGDNEEGDDEEDDHRREPIADYSHEKRDLTPSDINRNTSKLILPSEMWSISDALCHHCKNLKTVVFPTNLSTIGASAFKDCRKLDSIEFPATLTSIGNQAFMNCRRLKQIVIPAKVNRIDSEAFAGCDSLQSVVFEGNSIQLGCRAFADCPSLKHVKLPQDVRCFNKSMFFDNPFLNCPMLKDVPDLVSTKLPSLLTKDGDTEFYSSHDIIINSETTELHIPISLPRVRWSIVGEPSSLTDIYVPYPQPERKNPYRLGDMISDDAFYLDISDEIKSKITLHVPAECRRYYEVNDAFAKYSHIEEMSSWETHKLFALSVLYEAYLSITYKFYWSNTFYAIVSFILGLILLYYRSRLRKEAPKWSRLIVSAIGFTLLVVVTYLVLFWTLRLLFYWGDHAIPVAGVGALLLISACYRPDLLYKIRIPLPEISDKWKESFKHRVKSFFSPTIPKAKVGLAVILVALLTMFGWKEYQKDNASVSQLMEQQDYKGALRQFSDELLSKDSITSADADLLRNLLSLSGSPVPLDSVREYTYDKETSRSWGEGVDQHHGAFTVRSGNDIFTWDHDGMFRWNFDKDPFGGGSTSLFSHYDHNITYYNEAKDSSAIYWLSSKPEEAVCTKVFGKISNVFKTANLIFTDTKDGRMVFDNEGRGINIPAKRISWNSYYDKKLVREVGNSSIEDPSTLYGLTPNGPVCHEFEKGEVAAYVNDRFLAWDDDDDNLIVYDVQDSFKTVFKTENKWQHSVKSNGKQLLIERNRKNSVIYNFETGDSTVIDSSPMNFTGDYLLTQDKRLYNVNTMEAWDLGVKYNGMGAWSSRMIDNRYLLLYDYDYDLIHVFDMRKQAQVIGEINGEVEGSRNSIVDGYLCVSRHDSLCFYRFSNGRIFEGARLPGSMSETGYRSGNFVIDIVKDNADTSDVKTYMVYPLDVTDIKPFAFHGGERPVGYGNNLARTTEDKRVIIYKYGDLKELINNSPVLSDKTKRRLIEKLSQTQKL